MRRNATGTLALLVAGAGMMAALLALVPAAGHDQLWFLLMARRWMAGATPYGPEAFDSNPPMVVWLSMLPVSLAARVSVPASLVAKVLVTGLAGGIAVLALRALELSVGRLGREARLWLAFAFVVVFGAVPARDFGQRDDVGALLLLPYVLVAAGWVVGLRRSAAAGAERRHLALRGMAVGLAAVGVCLKPQLGLVPLMVEGVCLVAGVRAWRGDVRAGLLAGVRRVEPWCLVAAGGLYLVAIRVFAPLYLRAALPLTVLTYWAIGHLTMGELAGQAVEMAALLGLAAGCVGLAVRRGWHVGPAMEMLLVAGVAGVASYVVQGTGWYYQQLPGISFLAAVVALGAMGCVQSRGDLRWSGVGDLPVGVPVAVGALVFLAAGLTIHYSGFGFTPRGFDAEHRFPILQPDPAFFTGLAPGTRVAILTTSVDDAMMPVERYRLEWAQSMNNLWPLVAVLRETAPQAGSRGVPAGHRWTAAQRAFVSGGVMGREAQDLARWKPAVVLVARCQDAAVRCQELEDRHDDLLAALLQNAEFAAEWKRYRFVGMRGGYGEWVRGNS